MYTNQLKDIFNGVHSFDKIQNCRFGSATLPKNAPL